MAEFQSQSDAFLHWFRSQPGATFHPSLQITDYRSRNAGRGIIATNDIPAETDLFTIPRSTVISVENSSLSKLLPQIFSTHQSDDSDEITLPDPWLDLILVLIYEYLQGPSSPWSTYLSTLPSEFNTLMFWSDSELAQLQASTVTSKIGKSSANEMFATKVLPTIHAHSSIFYPSVSTPLGDDEIMHLAHRMGSLIMAYAFDLETDAAADDSAEDGWEEDREGAIAMGMVPMADMLNADAEFNAHLNHGEDSLTMTSLRPIAAGEEVLNYYGPLPTSDLLRRYGYTSAKHARYDIVEIPCKLVIEVVQQMFEGKQLGVLDDEEMEDSFVLERDAGEPDETGINSSEARLTAFPEELEAQVRQVIVPAVGLDVDWSKEKSKRVLKSAFLEIMARVLPVRLAMYGTSIPEDEQLLGRSDIRGRTRMAIEVRLGEKRLLLEAQHLVQNLLEKNRQVEPDAGDRPAKKQRMR